MHSQLRQYTDNRKGSSRYTTRPALALGPLLFAKSANLPHPLPFPIESWASLCMDLGSITALPGKRGREARLPAQHLCGLHTRAKLPGAQAWAGSSTCWGFVRGAVRRLMQTPQAEFRSHLFLRVTVPSLSALCFVQEHLLPADTI